MTSRIDQAPALRIGILGAAHIARQFTRDVAASTRVRVDAVASRTAANAAAFAAANGIERYHGSYDALLDDPAIDVVYLPLPNSMHAEWAIKAEEHGKHVLCEEPLALSAAEARSMFAAARRHHVMLLEAYPYYFQPATGALVQLIQSGAIGKVRSVQACFGFTLNNPEGNIRMDPALGGGALLDAGSYALSLIRLAMGCAPERVTADATWAATGVDLSLMSTLHYTDGRRAQLSCAMDTANHRRAIIAGTAGAIETEYLNHTSAPSVTHPLGFQPSELRVRRGTANSIPFETLDCGTGSGFRFAAEAFAKVVADGDVDAIYRAAAASLDNAATLEAIARSARSGRSEPVAAAL